MSDAKTIEAQVRECLRSVNDPEIGRSLVDLDMVGPVQVGDGKALSVTVQLPTTAYPRRERIAQAIHAEDNSPFGYRPDRLQGWYRRVAPRFRQSNPRGREQKSEN